MWWASYVSWFPPMFHLGAILPSIGYEAARRGYSYPPDAVGRAPGAWVALVGGTGSGKSAAITMARRLTREWQELTRPKNYYRDPYQQQEGTIQGLLYELQEEHWVQEYQRTVAILDSDEASRWLEMAPPELYCQLWDGQTVKRRLRGQQAAATTGGKKFDVVRGPALSAIMASTFVSLETVLKPQHFTGGLCSRFLWVVENEYTPRFTNPVDDAVYTTALDQWTRWSAWLDAMEAGGGSKMLEVDDRVKQFVKQMLFDTHLLGKQSSYSFFDELTKAAVMRCVTHAYMIAGLYAFSRGDTRVTLEDAIAATALVERSIRSLAELRPLVVQDAIYKVQMRVIADIDHVGQASKYALYEHFKVNKTVLDQVLAALEESSQIVRCTKHSGNRGGRPGTVFKSTAKALAHSAPVVPIQPTDKKS